MAPRPVCVVPARLEHDARGVPFSAQFGDVYHSIDGGLAQARHVFLDGNGLPQRWRGRACFTIVETGFGIGLNFLATWAAWRDDPQRPSRLHFVSLEKHPFLRDDLGAALRPFEPLRPLATALGRAWPPPIAGFHRLHFEGGRVALTLLFGDAAECLPQLEGRADALFLDGFAPSRNPQMWSPAVVRELARIAAPGATLATWTVAGGVRTALGDAGFRVERREGFASKREMLAGVRLADAMARPQESRAVIVGAGLAGTLVAERLAARGWAVSLLDERVERSSSQAGLVRPIANLRDAVNAQASRSAFLYALQHYRALRDEGYHFLWDACGVLQLAADEDEELRFATIARSQGYPQEFLEYVDPARATALAGRKVERGGWWFPSGAVVSVPSLAAASHARAGSSIHRVTGRRVERIEREGADWRALDRDGRVIAQARVLILANAADASRLSPETRLRLSSVRGQVTYLPAEPRRDLSIVVSGNGYVAPAFDQGAARGGHVIGATYRHDDFDGAVRETDHRENLARAESLLPGFTAGLDPGALDGWTGFRATVPDRLPIFGRTAAEGLHAATGLGSRGLLWGPLGAELLASQLSGDPLPLPRDLAAAVSPLRFLS